MLEVTDVPSQYGAAGNDRSDDRSQSALRRRVHAAIVRVRKVLNGAWTPAHRVFMPCSPTPRICTPGAPTLTNMREAFHDQLDAIFLDLAEMCGQVEVAVRDATKALMTGDASLAEAVISGDRLIDSNREKVEDNAFALLSLQQPVAGDLRVVVAALRMGSELERMGDLSVHVAKIARLRVPNIAVPDSIRATMEQMAEVAEDMVRRVKAIIAERDVEAAIALGRDDEIMDQLRRRSFAELLGDDWSHGVEAAVDIALLGRYYERIADHAVSVANRVAFVVTGELPQRGE